MPPLALLARLQELSRAKAWCEAWTWGLISSVRLPWCRTAKHASICCSYERVSFWPHLELLPGVSDPRP